MNHYIYADDIYHLAPSAIGQQQMLDVCFNFSIRNDIIFNPVKSACFAFHVTLDNNVLGYIGRTKYLGRHATNPTGQTGVENEPTTFHE